MAEIIPHETPGHAERRESVHFEALPPELRNMIYSFALCHESQPDDAGHHRSYPRLSAGPSATALALSHVSRSVRADSMAAYYGENTFLSIKRLAMRPLVPAILVWAWSWGVDAAPHVRSLIIIDKKLSPDCDQFRLDFNEPLNPVSYRSGARPRLLKNLSVEDMNALVLALFRPEGTLEISSRRLVMLVRAIWGGASGFVAMDAVQRNAVITDLETRLARDEEYWEF